MTQKGKIFLKCFVAAIAAIAFFSWITMLLWNWLVPVLFAGPSITFAQSLGLLVLTKILTFGFGGRRTCGGPGGMGGSPWKQRFYEKMSSLTPEEREAFKQKMRDKWCGPRERQDAEHGKTID